MPANSTERSNNGLVSGKSPLYDTRMSSEMPSSTGQRSFPNTRWSVVLAATKRASPEAASALETLCRAYWYPLYAYARRCGQTPQDAQDLTQEFFCRLLEKHWFNLADPEKGRLRTFLIVALKHFMAKEWRRASAQRRGGGRTPVQLDTAVAESRYAVDSSSLPADEAFDQQWALTLLDLTVNRLRDEFAAAGRPGDFEILKSCLMVDRGAIDYAAVVVHLPAVDRPELRSPLPLGTTRIERVTFNGLTAARIKELRFQIRPCQWVEVRNISLEPGRRTQVEVVNALGHPQ
jgi:RNA polymerase sigma-70 factor (ECF subfamily)